MIPLCQITAPDWQAQWVWLDPVQFPAAQRAPVSWWAIDAHQPGRPPVAGLVRRRFQLPDQPGRVWMRLSADSRYRLWVNERLAGRGPALVGGSYGKLEAPNWWYFDTFELSAWVRPGQNVLALEVTAGPDNQTHFSQGQAGLIAELRDQEGRLLLGTDAQWRGIAFTGYRTGQWTGFTRDCDLQAYPAGWLAPGFDDGSWPHLVRDTTSRPPLRAHALPALTELFVPPREGDTLTIPAGPAPTTVRLEFEQMLAGHLRFVAQASTGTGLDIGFEEVPGVAEGPMRGLRLRLPPGQTSYESPAYFSARALRLTATFPPGAAPLQLHGLGLLHRSQPVDYRGGFECSDPFLNQLWQTCRWSAQLCLQDIHLDSPHHQESLGDHGDYLVEMLMCYYAFGDYALAQEDLRRMALDLEQQHGAQFHTTYALLMPDLAANLLLYTGNAETARASVPAIRLVLQRILGWRGAEGLLSQAPNYIFVDWIEHAGANYHHPPAAQGMAALTAFAVRALRRAAWLARQLDGGTAEADSWETTADELAVAFRAVLYDPVRGLFRDGLRGINRQPAGHWLPPDPAQDVFTRHTNILAVWAGIVIGTEAARILELALVDPSLPEPQPYFQHYLFEALDRAKLYQPRARKQLDLWQPMLRASTHSLREMWISGDHSHAWGGTPLVQLAQRVLGVEPTAPGWRALRVRPHPLDVDWARGIVPTPRGPVLVAWQRHADGIDLSVELPTAAVGTTNGMAESSCVWRRRLGRGEELSFEFM